MNISLSFDLYVKSINFYLADSCTSANATNCAHFTNVDDQGNVLCMCKPGYRVDLSNHSNCIGE